MEVLHGKMTKGKLTATDNTNPNLTNSTRPEGGSAVRMFPVENTDNSYDGDK
jgi:hypothetical protein